MTREEVKNKFDSFGHSFTLDEARKDVHILIDSVFDDHESRICANCKHFETRNWYFNECMNHESAAYKIQESIPSTISCGEFERVEDEKWNT